MNDKKYEQVKSLGDYIPPIQTFYATGNNLQGPLKFVNGKWVRPKREIKLSKLEENESR